MCGIAGFLSAHNDTAGQLMATAQAMAERLRHRGPDDGGVWVDAPSGLAFSQRRLAIVDLSPAGHQPMLSSDGRYVINYNGEVYNADELRGDLQAAGRPFRGHSDTEVIVEGVAVWGVRATIERLIGMFALAVWDRQDRTLVLVRDRMGIKPLYYASFGGVFLFASELSALRAHGGWTPKIDRASVASFLRHNYIPAPHSIWNGVKKLEPGTMLTVSIGEAPRLERYWSLDDVLVEGSAALFAGDDADAVETLDALLFDAVRRRLVADVPVGAFLSGGIDSSTVVALMQRASDRPVRTFSIGFHEAGFNEATHAAAVARHLGTDHTELYVTPEEAQAVIPKLPHIYDEPFADSSQIPTYLVSAMTRDHVTVALSGDGGDELFAGYNRYFQARKVGRTMGALPAPLRRLAAAGLTAVPPKVWDRMFALVPASHRPDRGGDKVHKLASVLNEDEDDFYRRLVTHWETPNAVAIDAIEHKGILWDPESRTRVPEFVDRMRYWDMRTYLPDDILTKVDRASMAVSLEARVPILDHRVVEWSWTLAAEHRIRDSNGKWILRQVLDRYVPRSLIDRPKMGFGVPIDHWLRGPLKDWALDLLSPAALQRHGLLRPDPIQQRLKEHLEGRRNWQYPLWCTLMLQAWCDAPPQGPSADH